MAVRTEKIAVILEFLNEESKSLGRHVIEAQKLNKEIAALAVEEKKLANEAEKAAAAGKDTLAIETKRVKIQEELNQKMLSVLKTGKGIESLDLSKVAPTQLVTTAKELDRALNFLPKATEEYKATAAALKKVNDQLAQNRAETKGVAKGMQEASTASTKLGRIFELVFGLSLANLLEFAIGKIKEFGVELYKRAIDLEGFGRKTKMVFGEGTKDIEAFAERMSGRVGMSTASVLNDLNDISNSFTTLEFGKKDIAGLTKQLYGLSASWAEYNGGKYTALEVSEKFKVALGGEVDELAELGIVLTQDTLKKEMQKKGYDKLTGASFDQASALTLLELITRKTAEAQANFGTASETMAAKQNRIAATLKNTWDETARSLTGFFTGLLDTFGQVIAVMKEGKSPVGEYAEVMQFAATILKILGNALGVVWETGKIVLAVFLETVKAVSWLGNKVGDLIGWFVKLAAEAKNMPFLASLFGPILNTIGILSDLLTNASATFAGFAASAKQAITNVQNYMRALMIDAEILAAKLINTLNLGSSDSITATINDLENQKKAMFNAGKTVEQAYIDGRNAAIIPAKAKKADNTAVNDNVNYAAGVQFKKEIDPKEAQKMADAKLKADIEAAKAAMELELLLNEKKRLENTINEEKYQSNYHDIKKKWLEKEASIYKDAHKDKSLDAVKVQKELVELEKNTAATLLKMKMEDVDRETVALKTVAENRFLLDTEGVKLSHDAFEKRQQAFKLREIEIDKKAAEKNLRLLKEAHKEETNEYIALENTILKLKKNSSDIEQAQVEKDAKDKARILRDDINEAVKAEETEFERREGALRNLFVRLLITEQDYELQKLQNKKFFLSAEQQILAYGDEQQRNRAKKLGSDLVATDADIEAQKLKNKQRTAQLEFELQQNKLKMGHDALGIAIDLLSKDEASRKKHAKAIQAFEIGQIWVNTYAEISAIWKNNQKNPFYASIPGLAQGMSIAESALSIGRAVAGTQKVTATKFATGGFTSALGIERDETGEEPAGVVHAGEWVAPKWMVKQYRGIFNQLDNVRLGQIMDGQRTLLPRFADGGSVAFSLTPRSELVAPPQYGQKNYGVTDNSPDFYAMLKEMQMMRTGVEKWQKEFEVKMYYTKFTDKKNEIEADLVAGNL